MFMNMTKDATFYLYPDWAVEHEIFSEFNKKWWCAPGQGIVRPDRAWLKVEIGTTSQGIVRANLSNRKAKAERENSMTEKR